MGGNMIRTLLGVSLLAMSIALSGPGRVAAQDATSSSIAEKFRPAADQDGSVIVDYQAWTELLRDVVLDVGDPDRRVPPRREAITGSLIDYSSFSRYRDEANRVLYFFLEDDRKQAISLYRSELEALPKSVPLTQFSRDEQLAYWLNLHNVIVIDEIARQWPVRDLNRARTADRRGPFYDTDVATINGEGLTLNEIRRDIVYANWSDPRVIYGFFDGSLGGPNIMRTAFDGSNVWNQLEANANDFANSLRGVEQRGNKLEISKLYADAKPYFFPDWPNDVREHLSEHATLPVVIDLIASDLPIEATIEEYDIADLMNGSRTPTGAASSNIEVVTPDGRTSAALSKIGPAQVAFINRVIERRARQGRVIVIDIPTEDTTPRQAEPLGEEWGSFLSTAKPPEAAEPTQNGPQEAEPAKE
jgi:hypothetical protein